MITAVLDNNIIIDALARREPFNRKAEQIFEALGDDKFQGCITSNMATDLFYILKRLFDPPYARRQLAHLFNLFTVLTVTGKDCEDALSIPMVDYENAVLSVCAKKNHADVIVSRDEDFLASSSSLPVVSPADILNRL
jgi:predicted nucleic acid-binding protein